MLIALPRLVLGVVNAVPAPAETGLRGVNAREDIEPDDDEERRCVREGERSGCDSHICTDLTLVLRAWEGNADDRLRAAGGMASL